MTLAEMSPVTQTAVRSPVLEVEDLHVVFSASAGEVEAVDGVSFTLDAGRTIAIVGESGSGKTTTAACINGLLARNGRISAGRIVFEGRDLVGADEQTLAAIRGAGIGLVPQDPMSNLNPIQRVGRQVREALEVHGLARGREADRRVLELLTMVGIPEPVRRARQFPHELSGGMRQRVLIAIGLACRPRLLIADEPTSALDVTMQRAILDQLDELTAELGTAVILITHDLALAAERADEVIVMSHGQMIEHGSARTVLEAPRHEYSKALVAAVPTLDSPPLVGPYRGEEYPAIRLEKVRMEYRTPGRRAAFVAVDDVDLDIMPGQTVAIVGESGSGKSTTARLALGLESPSAGRVMVDGKSLGSMNKGELFRFRRRVQPVFQNPYGSLDERYTIEEAIAEPLAIHRAGTPQERRSRALTLMEQVGLNPTLARRHPRELSGGQCQRVAIARALALKPELVVLDEAVSALDVIVQAQILALLVRLQQDLGLGYLFISHDLAVVRLISHRVHVMRNGRIVESGTPEEIFDHPREDYTRDLIAAIPGGRR